MAGLAVLVVLLLFSALGATTQAQGPGRIVIYDPDGTALGELSPQEQPDDLAVGPDGEIYVNINQSHRIVRYSLTGEKLGEWQTDGEPGSIAVGPGGQVYVNINQSHRIVRYSPQGEKLGAVDTGQEGDAFAVGPGGQIYVNINQSHRIVRFGPDGETLGIWNVDGDLGPLDVDPGGQVYVRINQNHRAAGDVVARYSPDGVLLDSFPVEGTPDDLAVGPKGEVYVNINQSHRIVRYDQTGEIFAQWQTPDTPTALALGPNGRVYVAMAAGGQPAPTPTPVTCPQDANEPNDDRGQATSLAPNIGVQGYICPQNDQDWFAVALHAGDILDANLTGPAADFDLILWSAGANPTPVVLSQNRGTAPESFSYLARSAGTYYLQVLGYGGGSSTQPYRLQANVQSTAGGKPGILQFDKGASVYWPTKVKVGDIVTYTLGIEHIGGTAPLANLVLTDVLPFEAVMVGTPTARAIRGTFGPLTPTFDSTIPPHGAVRWQGSVAPDSRGEIQFAVRVTGCPRGTYDPEGNPVMRNTGELLRPDGFVATAGIDVWVDCTPPPLSGAFQFTKRSSVQPGTKVKVGDKFFYLLDVAETSTSQVITNPTSAQLIGPVVLGDWLPPQLKLVYVNGQPGVGVQTVKPSVMPFNTQVLPPRIVGWEAFVTPGSQATFAYLAEVTACPPPDANGDHIIRNTAKLQLPNSQVLTATTDVSVDCPTSKPPNVTLNKHMRIPRLQVGPSVAGAGAEEQVITPDAQPVFEFTLTNEDDRAFSIVVTDTLPEGLTATDVQVDVGEARIEDGGRTIVWNVDAPPGSKAGMIAYTKPSMKLICEQQFINQAQWATQLPDGSTYSGQSNLVSARLVCRDLGDAPDSSNHSGLAMEAYSGVQAHFPTVYDTSTGSPPGPVHLLPLSDAWLGDGVSGEQDADRLPDMDGLTNLEPITDTANRDRYDDGLHLPITFPHCEATTVQVVVTVKGPQRDRYLNAWFDWNRDGDWEDTLECPGGPTTEWAVRDYVTNLGPGTHVVSLPAFLPFNPQTDALLWARITLSEKPAPVNPSTGLADGRGPDGGYAFGETEDYLIGGAQGPDMVVWQRHASLKKVTGKLPSDPNKTGTFWRAIWSASIKNQGIVSAANVVLVDRFDGFPLNMGSIWNLSSYPPSGATLGEPHVVTATFSSIKPGVRFPTVLTVHPIPITTTPGTVFTNTVTISADKDVDPSNNTSVLTLTVPLLPPTIAYPLPGTTCSGDLTVTGQAQIGTFVDLYVDGVYTATTTVDPNTGAWDVPLTLPDGTHTVYAKARTVLGEESQPSPTVKVIVNSTLSWDPMSLRFVSDSGWTVIPQGKNGRVDVGAWTLSLRKGFTYTAQVRICCQNPGAVTLQLPQVGSRNLTDPDNDGIYTVSFQTPVTGTIQGKVRICVVDKLIQKCSDGEVTIDPEGRVYDPTSGQLVPGALVAALQSQVNAAGGQPLFQLWPGADFGQVNPQTTPADGYFSFFTPPGTYRLQVNKEGYQPYLSPNLTVVDRPVHFDVPLTPQVDTSPTLTITVDSDGFHPGVAQVAPGSTVAWVNMDVAVHSSTSITPGVSCEACPAALGPRDAWDSGLLEPGVVYRRTLTAEGTYAYRDAANPLNTATVIVATEPATTERKLFLPVVGK